MLPTLVDVLFTLVDVISTLVDVIYLGVNFLVDVINLGVCHVSQWMLYLPWWMLSISVDVASTLVDVIYLSGCYIYLGGCHLLWWMLYILRWMLFIVWWMLSTLVARGLSTRYFLIAALWKSSHFEGDSGLSCSVPCCTCNVSWALLTPSVSRRFIPYYLIKTHKRLKWTLFNQDKTIQSANFRQIFAFDTATRERTNRCKTTYISRTYLDVTCAESGLESPPFSQMSSMGNHTNAQVTST